MTNTLTDNRIDDNRRSYAFTLGNKLVDQMFKREQGYTSHNAKKVIEGLDDVVKRYMLEAFIEGYIIAKEKSEERIGDKIIW
jgi:hypothetical protein